METPPFTPFLDQRQNILRHLTILTSFQALSDTTVSSIVDVFGDILKKYDESQEKTEAMQCENFFERYMRTLVDQLNLLASPSVAENVEEPFTLFSVSERNVVKKGVEFLIGFGIFPLLEPGVVELKPWSIDASLEDSRKQRFVADLLPFTRAPIVLADSERIRRNFETLGSYADCLFTLWNCQSLKTTISSNFIAFMLASLFQLTCAQSDWDIDSVTKYNRYLSSIIEGSYRPTIIRELITFQSRKSTLVGKEKASAPSWLASASSRYLSSFIIEPRGILTLLRTLDESGDSSSSLNGDWKRCDALATLVSSRPRIFANDSHLNYYDNVCLQLAIDKETRRRFPRFFVDVVRKLSTKCKIEVERRILRPIFGTFRRCFEDDTPSPSEETLSGAIDDLKLLYTSPPADASFSKTLSSDVITILLHLLLDLRNTASYCRGAAKEIISGCFENGSWEFTFLAIQRWILHQDYETDGKQRRRVRFVPGSTGGVAVTLGTDQALEELPERIELLTELSLTLSTEFRRKLFDQCFTTLASPGIGSLDNCDVLSFVSLVVSLIEHNPDLASSSRVKVLKLCEILLKKNGVVDSGEEDEDIKTLKTQNLLLTFGILGSLFSATRSTKEIQDASPELQTLLRSLGDNYFDINVRSAARDLHFSIFASSKTESVDYLDTTTKLGSSEPESSYVQALRDVADPLLPVRAHALVVLANLIKSNDPTTCANIDSLISVFVDRLDEEDPFVYLAAVNCLSAAGLRRPNVVLPVLLEMFRGGVENVEGRLKVGEAIVKISRELGDLAPFYGNELLNAFLSLLREGDEEIKASCLANVAEICRLMSFKLNSYISEVFYCAEQLLRWEKAPLVRRAAMNLLALLTENGDEFLEILGDSSREFYQLAKGVQQNDEDPVVRLHADKCLENLGEHAKKILKPLITPLY